VNVLLLADRSPSLRYRALTELEGLTPDDPEAAEAQAAIATSVDVERVLATPADDVTGLAYRLCRLAHLRYDGPELADTAEQLFARQLPDGSWPLWLDEKPPAKGKARAKRKSGPAPQKPRSEWYTMIPMQTALPLRGVAAAGYATDPRAERAYDWLLDQRLGDGSWPGDRKVDLPPSDVPGYRKLPGSTGCRTNTTGAVACLALHPERRTSAPAGVALDHVLAAVTRQEWSLGWEVARLLGVEPAKGRFTFYARMDLAFLLDLATRCGASASDPRLAELVDVVERRRGPFGLWEHPSHPQLSRWLTLDLDTSLQRLTV
jgi:hypothetical protein